MDRGSVIKFSFNSNDVFRNTRIFKDHRAYVKYRFAEMGYEVVKWNWDINPATGAWENDEDGIRFKKNDSDIELSIEVSGIMGVSLRELRVVADAAGN